MRTQPALAPASTATAYASREHQGGGSFTAELAAVLFLVYLLLAASDRLEPGNASAAAESAASPPQHARDFKQLTKAMHRYLGVLVLTNMMLGAAVWETFICSA